MAYKPNELATDVSICTVLIIELLQFYYSNSNRSAIPRPDCSPIESVPDMESAQLRGDGMLPSFREQFPAAFAGASVATCPAAH
jgi:hypothetical protein